MANFIVKKPEATEYAAYFEGYVSLVPDGDIRELLTEQIQETLSLLQNISESQSNFRYAEGKWSIKQLVGHIIDGERVFAFRALSFARGDTAALPSMSQDDYINNAAYDDCRLDELADEFGAVRISTFFMFRHLNEAAWSRTGIASDNVFSVRALAYIIAGHEIYHRAILRERYLNNLGSL